MRGKGLEMPRVDLSLRVPVERTPRVQQVEGMFQLPAASESAVRISLDVDLDAKPWQIGLITGPSGCGKTSVARCLFGDALIEGYSWEPDRAIVDGFGELDVIEITAALSVGHDGDAESSLAGSDQSATEPFVPSCVSEVSMTSPF